MSHHSGTHLHELFSWCLPKQFIVFFSAVGALCSPECVIEFSSAAEGSSMEETDGVSLPHG
jgi:hypothetical protein